MSCECQNFRNYETYAECAERKMLVGFGRYVRHATPHRVSDQKKTLDIYVWQLVKFTVEDGMRKMMGWRNNLDII